MLEPPKITYKGGNKTVTTGYRSNSVIENPEKGCDDLNQTLYFWKDGWSGSDVREPGWLASPFSPQRQNDLVVNRGGCFPEIFHTESFYCPINYREGVSRSRERSDRDRLAEPRGTGVRHERPLKGGPTGTTDLVCGCGAEVVGR